MCESCGLLNRSASARNSSSPAAAYFACISGCCPWDELPLLTRQFHRKPDTRRPNVFQKTAYLGRIGGCGTKHFERNGGCMAALSPREVSRLLVDWGNGDQAALDELIPLVYDELRRLAGRYM